MLFVKNRKGIIEKVLLFKHLTAIGQFLSQPKELK